MIWETFAVAAVLVLILGGAVVYICKAKKRGVKCIGCPDGATCSDIATVVSVIAVAAAETSNNQGNYFL